MQCCRSVAECVETELPVPVIPVFCAWSLETKVARDQMIHSVEEWRFPPVCHLAQLSRYQFGNMLEPLKTVARRKGYNAELYGF